jgi:hypothetical protein
MNDEQQTQQIIIPEVVCPQCYHLLSNPAIIDVVADGYSRTIRRYFGWCFKCNNGFEVFQFQQNEHWKFHKYRTYRYVGNIPHYIPSGNYIEVQALPEPAPVVLGPGGKYNQSYDLDTETCKLFHTLKATLTSTLDIIDKLLSLPKNISSKKDE